MSSRLIASRALILDALEAGGLNPSSTGQWSAPCVLVEPGDPWAAVETMGRKRVGRWRLTIVAGRADGAGALETLAELVDMTDTALLTVAGVELPTWSRVTDIVLAGAAYAAATATVQFITPAPSEVLP